MCPERDQGGRPATPGRQGDLRAHRRRQRTALHCTALPVRLTDRPGRRNATVSGRGNPVQVTAVRSPLMGVACPADRTVPDPRTLRPFPATAVPCDARPTRSGPGPTRILIRRRWCMFLGGTTIRTVRGRLTATGLRPDGHIIASGIYVALRNCPALQPCSQRAQADLQRLCSPQSDRTLHRSTPHRSTLHRSNSALIKRCTDQTLHRSNNAPVEYCIDRVLPNRPRSAENRTGIDSGAARLFLSHPGTVLRNRFRNSGCLTARRDSRCRKYRRN